MKPFITSLTVPLAACGGALAAQHNAIGWTLIVAAFVVDFAIYICWVKHRFQRIR